MFLTKTYSIEDIYKYIPCTSDNDEFWFGGGNHTYSNDGLRLYGATSEKQVFCKTPIVNPMEVSCVFVGNGNTQSSAQPLVTIRGWNALNNNPAYNNSVWGGITGNGSSTPNKAYYVKSDSTQGMTSSNVYLQSMDIIRLRIENNTVSCYLNDTLLFTETYSYGANMLYWGWYLNNGRDWTIKDFKMKEL